MKPAFQWQDPFLLADQLSDDERAVAEAAHAFCQEKLQPRVLLAARHETFDREIMREFGSMGFLGSTIEGYGCAGLNHVSYGLVAGEADRFAGAYRGNAQGMITRWIAKAAAIPKWEKAWVLPVHSRFLQSETGHYYTGVMHFARSVPRAVREKSS